MDESTRVGLVEVPSGLPTFASRGLEARAAQIGAIAASSVEYLAGLLGRRPDVQVVVLSEADWPSKGRVPVFGLPNASKGTLVVAGEDPDWWSSLADFAGDGGREEIVRVYGEHDSRVKLGAFFDLVAVHEVAHLFVEDTVHFPRLWLGELFPNVCLQAWVEKRAPESLPTLLTLPRLGATAPAEDFERRTRAEFESDYSEMSAPNYVWYQFRLQMEALALFEALGEQAVQRLFRAFLVDADSRPPISDDIDDEHLAEVLSEKVDPSLGAFSLAF